MNEQIQEAAQPPVGAPNKSQWWDECETAPNLTRTLQGTALRVRDRTVTVTAVTGFAVGVDSRGIFPVIGVETSEGEDVNLYADGEITDHDDNWLGTHSINSHTIKDEGTAA